MPTFFAAVDHRSSPPQMYVYQGSAAVATGSTFSTAETTGLNELDQAPRIAQFGPRQQLFAFVGDGVYRTQDGGNVWEQIFVPTNLTAADSRRFGPLVLYMDNEPYLCIAYRASDGYRMARSKDGVGWEESPNAFGFSRDGGVTNLAIHGSRVFNTPTTDSTSFVRWFDFQTLTAGQTVTIFSGGPETGGVVIHDDRVFFLMYQDGSSPDRIQLFEILGGSTPTLLATFDEALSGTSGGAAWSSNNRIYYIARGAGAGDGLRLYRTNTGLTSFEEITTSGVPTALQNDNNATVSKVMVDPTGLSGEIELYVRNSTSSWDIYRWNSQLEKLELYAPAVGSTLHSLPFAYTVTGTQFYNPTAARVDVLETETTIEGVKIYFRLYGENGAAQSANVAFTYATDPLDVAITNPATLVNASAGTISGNQVNGLSTNNGATLYTVVWDLRSDGFDPEARFKIIGTMSINRPARRRRKRRKWYDF